ncbi:TetR family transcriptional regulator [Mycolicibacterium conceptionense]|uniref:TetR family transcriptional regulator n=1 Tax=Mycolicibacterium conceptionense TaxID=451644 RepID=A0A0U1DHR5_9MYCO|nr:TetR family transcriptional regulator [Mycolicibacterium conceptionense]
MSATLYRVASTQQVSTRWAAVERSAAQTRILDAALALIADHGVSGTSLQMIADAVGITKAGVYRQFRAKEDLVIALTERQLAKLEPALEVAEAEPDVPRARELLLISVIDLAVTDRKTASALQFDPVIVRLLAEHRPFEQFIERLYGVLIGDASEDAQLGAAMMSGAIFAAVMHPLAAELDESVLRSQLLRYSKRFLHLPEA